jgi:hypothetical protein
MWVTLIFISFTCLLPLIHLYNLDAPNVRKGEVRAEPLIAAIAQYKKDWGEYPTYLSYLPTKYISKIPKAGWRHEYCYDPREDGQSYTLAFVPNGEFIGDGWDVYSSILESWQRVDSGFSQPCHFRFDLYYE